jgi:signal transduction histidine kinase
MAFLGGCIALVTGMLGFLLARRALAPLGELATQVGNGQQPVPKVDPARYPSNEIGVLADRLSSAFERIRGFIAREQAFTREASHELRTPIAVIRGSAEVVALQPGLSDASTKALQRIEAATQDIVGTLDLLLGLAREERMSNRDPILIRPIVTQAVEDVQVRFPDASLRTEILIEPDATILARRTLLQLILNNLITNSFVHSHASRLTISFRGGELTISDDGVGIARATARADAADQSSGTGLGLLIVQRLCEAGGILLTIADCEAGTGTRITLRQAAEWKDN